MRKNAKRTSARYGFGLVNIAAALAAANKKLPQVEDLEPNDNQGTAQVKPSCARTCTLRGLVTPSDDKADYWRLSRRGKCPKRLKATGGVTANCFRKSGRGGGTFVKVQAKKSVVLGLYSVTVPRR